MRGRMICRNCGKTVVYEPITGKWYHKGMKLTDGMLRFCEGFDPHLRMKAVPAGGAVRPKHEERV